MSDKVILTDVDGVLLDWRSVMDDWLDEKGYIRNEVYGQTWDMSGDYNMSESDMHKLIVEFSDSSAIGYLHPLPHAVENVKKLAAKGYTFIALSAVSNNIHTGMARADNLYNWFGDVFEEVICIDTGASKDRDLMVLAQHYPGAYWIEDHVVNLESGIRHGLRGILMLDTHSQDYEGTTAESWKDVLDIITEREDK